MTRDTIASSKLDFLGKLKENDFEWEPYQRLDLDSQPEFLREPAKSAKSRTVLLSFEKAVYHRPNLSPRQFSLGNEFVCRLSTDLIEIIKLCERFGKSSKDWSAWGAYKLYNEEWRKRYNLLIDVGEEAVTLQPSKNQGAESPRRSSDTVMRESPYEHFYETSEAAGNDCNHGTGLNRGRSHENVSMVYARKQRRLNSWDVIGSL